MECKPYPLGPVRRGKFDVGLFVNHLVVATAKDDVAVPYAAIKSIAILDDLPKDTKGRVLLYLHLDRRAACTPSQTLDRPLLCSTP